MILSLHGWLTLVGEAFRYMGQLIVFATTSCCMGDFQLYEQVFRYIGQFIVSSTTSRYVSDFQRYERPRVTHGAFHSMGDTRPKWSDDAFSLGGHFYTVMRLLDLNDLYVPVNCVSRRRR